MIVCPWKELHRYAAILPGLEEAVKLVASLESLRVTSSCRVWSIGRHVD